jgi:1,4-alpha-glucan branching enzyme
MIYLDHGLSRDFTHYDFYFDDGEDEDAIAYLKLANKLIHEINPNAISIAEEMSGMPGLASPSSWGGLGFDYRMAMGIPDFWIKIIKEKSDNEWDMAHLYHELTIRRTEEKTIGYAESHDQALVGDKTIIFRLIDKDMYWHMNIGSKNLDVERGIALHKMIRLITATTSGGGYLNFMGNEFGHPEWIDFPREGNNWSFKHARRQWSLVDNPDLRYKHLNNFDNHLINLLNKENLLSEMYIEKVHDNNNDKVLIYKRGNFLFAFNFHPTNSYTDYGINTHGGKYNVVLHTDEPEFGGFSRIDDSITYFTQRTGKISSSFLLKLYLPSRTGIVFKFVPTPSVRDRARMQ